MALELAAKFVEALPLVTGTSSRGSWSKQEFVVETIEQYPKKICISLWGDRVQDIVNVKVGETLTISINIESRQYNDRWYTDVRAWKIVRGAESAYGQAPTPPVMDAPGTPSDLTPVDDNFDDLPF